MAFLGLECLNLKLYTGFNKMLGVRFNDDKGRG